MENPAVKKGSKLFKFLSNKKRLEVVYILRDGEKKVRELEKIVGLSQSALSQHLAILRTAGIVETNRQAQTVFYSIKSRDVIYLLKLLDDMYN